MTGQLSAGAGAWRPWFLAATAVLLFALTCAFVNTTNVNVRSRLATAESLIERGTFAIEGASLHNHFDKDKVFVRGHFYSEKPPLLSLLAAAVYSPLHAAGFNLRPHSRLVPALLTFLILGSSFLLCLYCFADALLRAGLTAGQQAFMTSILAFGTLYLTWNTTFSNHGFVASWLFIALYCWLRARAADWDPRWMLRCGIAVAIAVGADYSVLPFALLVCMVAALHRRYSAGIRIVLPLLALLLPALLLNYLLSGSIRPLQIQAQLFRYPGSWWTGSQEHLSGIAYNSPPSALHQAYLMLIGADGFLVYCPVLLIAIVALVVTVIRRRQYWQEGVVVLLFSVLFVGYYSLATTNLGGFNYSNRWFAELVPIVWFFAFPVFRRIGRAKLLAISLLFAFSAVVALTGTINPWQGERPAFFANIYSLMPGAKR